MGQTRNETWAKYRRRSTRIIIAMSYNDRKDSQPSTSGYTPYGSSTGAGFAKGQEGKLLSRPDFSNLPAFEKVARSGHLC